MTERIIDYDNLPILTEFDGDSIQRRIECDGCKYLVKTRKEETPVDVCAWGVAWKVLKEVEKQGKCQKVHKSPPIYMSKQYIDRSRKTK